MAKCIWCGASGLFLSVDKNGLCRRCQAIIYSDIQQRLRIIEDSQKLIEESKNFSTRIGRVDTFLKQIHELKKYEEKKITTLEPVPSEIEKKLYKLREELIFENIVEEIDKIMNKAKLALTPKTKMSGANKALIRINERKEEVQEEEKIKEIEEKEKELKKFIHDTKLNEYLDEAKKAEFKGKKTKALDKYQEALYFLQNDEIDDSLQKEKINELKAKISELT